jgi:chromosome segregation ATPase
MHLGTIATKPAQEWEGVIADLAAKQQASQEHNERLRTQKQELALEAAMGSTDAKKRLKEINAELAKLALEGDDFDAAIRQAESAWTNAEHAEAEAAEHDRRAKIGESMKCYRDSVSRIDAGLAALVEHFKAATANLDAAEALMTATESQYIRQLRTVFGPTLAASHFGLGRFLELGPTARHIQDRQPLEAYARPRISGWVDDQQEGE